MTIPANTPRVSYVGDAVTTAFAIPFYFYAASDITTLVNGVVQASGVTITGGNDGPGTATFLTPPASAAIVTILLTAALSQSVNLSPSQELPTATLNQAFDRAVMLSQRLADQVSRAITAPDGDVSPLMQLPNALGRASTVLAFDANGNVTVSSDIPVGTLTQALFNALLAVGITTVPGQYYVLTAAEGAVGVTPTNFSYPSGNILRYGADPTGTAVCDGALTSALLVVGATGTNGGTIHFPAGTYLFHSPWNLNQLSGVIIEGEGCATAGAGPGTLINYNGTGSTHWIQFTSVIGCKLRRMTLNATSNSFTGAILRCGNDGSHGDSSICSIEEVSFIGSTSCYHLDLDKVNNFYAVRCNFLTGATSVKGQNSAGGSYANVVSFDECRWGGSTAVPVNSLGQSWSFRSCTWEPLANNAPGAIVCTPTAFASGFVLEGCWFGDSNATAGSWLSGSFDNGLIAGNLFAGNVAGTTALTLNACFGLAILGNNFVNCLNCFNFVTNNSGGIVAKANINNGGVNAYVGTATFLAPGQLDFQLTFGFGVPSGHGNQGTNGSRVHPDGTIEQWGLATNQVHGSNTVTFPIAFISACYNVQCSLSAVAATTATVYPSGLTTTQFTATIQDGTSTTDSFYWRVVGK